MFIIIYRNAGQDAVNLRQRLKKFPGKINNQRQINNGWWAGDGSNRSNIAGGAGLPRGGMLRISVSLQVVRRYAEAKISLS